MLMYRFVVYYGDVYFPIIEGGVQCFCISQVVRIFQEFKDIIVREKTAILAPIFQLYMERVKHEFSRIRTEIYYPFFREFRTKNYRVIYGHNGPYETALHGQYLQSENVCACIVAPDERYKNYLPRVVSSIWKFLFVYYGPDKRERRERKDLSFVECLLFSCLFQRFHFPVIPRARLKSKERRRQRRNSDNTGNAAGKLKSWNIVGKLEFGENFPNFNFPHYFPVFRISAVSSE